jgi:hypothetical protein
MRLIYEEFEREDAEYLIAMAKKRPIDLEIDGFDGCLMMSSNRSRIRTNFTQGTSPSESYDEPQ